MKKLLLFLLLLSSIKGLSQSINVNTSTYTVPQLVNNVLINSSCVTANNISWSTGTNFGSVNGIGYFSNNNPNFPMQSGVVLSTGNVLEAGGPNTTLLSSGSSSWAGDATLEATLAASGISMNSTNASVLQFDFVALSNRFDFKFLFASEEYGNFQCQYSDAFAFLLTNLNTGVSTNLAVIPGTSNPISVVTIRDFLYNSNCTSENAQYFGSFNGGSNAATSAINFNGQTVPMDASAVLVPNTPYRIKLVIADRGDYKSDSAIFISSNSFNIGQDVLGSDLLISNNTAVCYGQTHLINSGLNPSLYTFTWKKNGVLLSGQNGPDLTVSQAGTYELTYTSNALPCQVITNEIKIEYYPIFNTPNPKTIYKCNTGQSTYSFNLAYNTPIVIDGLDPNTQVSYHSSMADANTNSNALPLNYNSAGNQTIYVRINNTGTGCYTVKPFLLSLVASPVANHPNDYLKCAGAKGKANFGLTTLIPEVLNGQSPNMYKVYFYKTLANANSGTNPITALVSLGTTAYIRVELITDPSCYSITTVNLVVTPPPTVDIVLDVISCADYALPPLTNGNYFTGSNGGGTALFAGDLITETQNIYIYVTDGDCTNQSNFKVTIVKPEDLAIKAGIYCGSYTLPKIKFGEYHTAPNRGGMNLPGGTKITTSQTIYFNFVTLVPPICNIDEPFVITIVPAQIVPTLPNAFDCNSYVLQPLAYGTYYDGPNGTGNQLPAGTAITSSKTIYIKGDAGSCKSESSFEVVIGSSNFPTSITECSSYTLPELLVGNYYTGPNGTGSQIAAGTTFFTTQTIYVYAPSQSQPNCTDNYNFTITITLPQITVPTVTQGCNSFILPSIPAGNYYTQSGGNGTMLHAGDVLLNSKTIYIYLNDGNGCQNQVSFNVTVNQTPDIDSRAPIDACNSYTLTNLAQGNYYTGPNGTGTMLSGGTILTDSQLVYIYGNNNGCVAETSFQITIFKTNAHQLPNIAVCDSYTLPALPGNNKYYTQSGGQYGSGVLVPAGTVINSTQTLYIFIESAGRINCTNETSFTITVNHTPVIAPIANVKTCNSYILPALALGDYYTQTNKGGTKLHAGDVITSTQTLYVYAETGTATNCFSEKSFTITIFNVDELQNVTICSGYTLPTLVNGNYYNGPNGTGGMITQGTIIHTTKTIYVYGTSPFSPSCSDQSSFTVTIIPQPIVNSVPTANKTICDDDGTNDGIFNFNLTTLNSAVLGSQTGPEFSVAYYESLADATTNHNPKTNSIVTTIYARVNNALAPNCFDVKPITLTVNKLPEPKPTDGIICIVSETGHLISPYMLYSGLSSATHTFKWYNEQGQLVGTAANYKAILPGIYGVIATSIATGCPSAEAFATVTPSEPAKVTYEVSEDFAETQSITITATGTGIYEYQLDDNEFQDSPVFNNILSGLHTVTVRDKNGCGMTVTDAVVINYPHFFTPNGDGINDTWNIKDLKGQTISLVYIFDRYGKLIKKIKPSGQGWDGTYENTLLQADDYWFSINYQKNGEEKEFKSHFTLKR